MNPGNLSRSEYIAAFGGVLLGICVFLPWYEPNPANENAIVAGSREAVSAWDAHMILRYFFLLAAIAPIVLAYIVMRDHELSWPRGELTAVIGLIAALSVFWHRDHRAPRRAERPDLAGIGWYRRDLGRDPDRRRRRDARRAVRTPPQATRSPVTDE